MKKLTVFAMLLLVFAVSATSAYACGDGKMSDKDKATASSEV